MVLVSTNHWEGTKVVITEKMDGECTTLARDYMHARSPNYNPHLSRTRVRAEWGRIRNEIPPDWKVCGENVSAAHSIKYTNLSSYFLVFSIWDESRCALSWDKTEEWVEMLGLNTVPVLWRGIWDEDKCREIINKLDLTRQEGVVIRPAGRYDWDHIADKRGVMGKWVRKGHITTNEHWMKKPVEWNLLKGES
jgi:ATP-dependent RNA circularization protein (DNA/RNA ligase family)